MLHMIKLAVGCPTLDVLDERMRRERVGGNAVVYTRTMPRRAKEILAGGSLYRVLDGMLLCRQPIIGLESCQRPDGSTGTLIFVSDDIIPVQPCTMRPFQGWRYLAAKDAPPDLGTTETGDGITELPQKLRRELAELALI